MRKTLFIFIAMVFLLLVSCEEKSHNADRVHKISAKIIEPSLHIIDHKSFNGYLSGVNFERNEFYIDSLFPVKNNAMVRIIDARTGKEKRTVPFPLGDSQSPTLFTEPSYIEFLEDKYFVYDHIHKIVVYDKDFNYLYTGMSPQSLRVFIDFYSYDSKIFYVLGRSKNQIDNYRYNVELYAFPRNEKPFWVGDLFETFHESPYPRSGSKYYYIIFFRSSNWGFEKNGCIYYADNRENRYYRYDLATGQTDAFELSFLMPRIFTQEEADRAANYKNQENVVKGLTVVIVPSKEAMYHQGLFDVGKDKIGVIGDVDMRKCIFRLDILDSRTGQYRFSLRLPFGEGFLRRTSSRNLGYIQSYIDLDEGIYIWPDIDGETQDGNVQLTRFIGECVPSSGY